MTARILVVDDDPVQRRILEAAIAKMGYSVSLAEDGEKAVAQLDGNGAPKPDVMVLDLQMPGLDGLGVMAFMAERNIDIPVIVQTASGGVEVAVAAMRAGAFDFAVKPASPDKLARAIKDALKVETNTDKMRRQPNKRGSRKNTFIGSSETIGRVLSLVTKAAASDIPVLIEGESGTGKELIAKSVQAQSQRANKPFVTVNCGAIPENLVESILFGHEKGAFTGATEKHTGKFIEADGGTLFLDEIGDLPLEAQVKVLRAIQDGEVEPVGARTSRKVNVRLISATHRDLIAAVREGRFREDLYYRLNVFPVLVPPLRYRKDDIPALARHFVEAANADGQFSANALSADAIDLLMRHDWPGNVRQLQNAIFRAVVLCEGQALRPEHFPQITAQVEGIKVTEPPSIVPDYADTDMVADNATDKARETETGQMPTLPLEHGTWLNLENASGHMRTLTDLEGEVITSAITRYSGRMSEVARRLGIGRSTLYRKLKEHQIEPTELV